GGGRRRVGSDWSSDVCSSDLVLGPVQGLEVTPRRVVAGRVGAEGTQLLLADAEGDRRHLVRRHARRPQRPEEGPVAVAEDRVERSEERRVGKGWRDRWATARA